MRVVLPEERETLSASSAALEGAHLKVRELQRTRDLAHGPRKPGPVGTGPGEVGSGPGNKEDALRAALGELETRSLARAALSTQVPNPTTGSWLSLTMEGRGTLRDLEVWRTRLPSDTLVDLLAWVEELRHNAQAHVARAVLGAGEASGPGHPPLFRGEGEALRSSQLLLSFAPGPGAGASLTGPEPAPRLPPLVKEIDPSAGDRASARVAAASFWFHGGRAPGAGREVLAFGGRLAERSAAVRDAALPERALLAALLSGGPAEGREALEHRVERMSPILGGGTLLSLASAVLSAYGPPDWTRRRSRALGSLARLGYAPEPRVLDAAGLLASSPVPEEELSTRSPALDPEARSRFADPCVAGALLASMPLTLVQGMALLGYARAAVSQRSFFGDTLEIDHQALLLAFGTLGEPPLEDAWARSFLPVVYAYHDRWVHRALLEAVRQHPAHDHSVPVYG